MRIKIRRWMSLFAAICCLPLANLLFQNCGRHFRASDSNSLFTASLYKADLVWRAHDAKNILVNEFMQIDRWLDVTGNLIGLYPPLRAGSSSIDFEKSPRFETTEDNKNFINLKDKKEFRTISENLRALLSDRYTVSLFINSVDIPLDQHKIVRVFDLLSPNGIADGYVGLDVSATHVTVFYYFGETSYHWVSCDITSEDLQKGLGIVVRYGPDYESVALSVNGKMASQKNTSTVPPPFLGNVTRSLRLNTGYDGNGGYHLFEIALWKSALTDSELTTFSEAYYNSYVLGRGGVVNPPTGGGSQSNAFNKVATIFTKTRASGSCVGCHGSMTQKSWLLQQKSNGISWVLPGQSADSLLVKAIRRTSGAVAMPPSGSAIAEDEIKRIEDWIQSGAK